MTDRVDIDMTRLTAYLWNECSDAERLHVEAWLAGYADRQALVAQLRAVLRSVEIPTPTNFDLAALQHDIAHRIRRSAPLAHAAVPRGVLGDTPWNARRSWSRLTGSSRVGPRWGRGVLAGVITVAGVLAVAVGIVGATRGFLQWRPGSDAGMRYVTRAGERLSVTLRDGTTIMLAPQTTLSLAPRFGEGTRTVQLSGEAYFTVPTATGVPFVVRTGRVTTRVLGTTFAVRRYTLDEPALVMVTSGKVSASGTGPATTASAGGVLHVTDSTVAATTPRALGIYTDWENGRLVFNTVPISEMLVAVGRWYGYQFRLTDSTLAKQRVTATFKVADANDMFTALRNVLDVSMAFDGRIVTLIPRDDIRPPHTRPREPLVSPSQSSKEMGR